ncbi:ankyrin-1 [Caerostris darwini]|uniref:Ankyrin-1 n=1 Tax=Caerostris darwini TaxID=1538125 RepID=A0AAV4QUY3_9ARAC|nr:ankyrin-1 [Caerostris darwini]
MWENKIRHMVFYSSQIERDLASITKKSSRKRLVSTFQRSDEVSAKTFYLSVLRTVKKFIADDEINSLKHLDGLLFKISGTKEEETIQKCFEKEFGSFNLVALACKYKAIKVLEYLFSENVKGIYNLSVKISKTAFLWSEVDEFHHNAFYYAIRSNMTHLLNILIEKGQNKYHKEELDEVLSKAHRELKLRNVFLTREMDFFVQSKILDLRFFHESADETTGNSWIHIEKRIDLVVENITIIKSSYWDKDVDEIFVLKAEFIGKNIHVLKFLLKSTYDRLPWEEIEFCLAVFIRCCKKRVADNLFYCCVFSKEAFLQHLENFSKLLDSEQKNFKNSDVIELSKPLRMERTEAISKIIKNHPEFRDLYADYESIRDHYSLESVKKYADLAIAANAAEKGGQLLVVRALQVMGEHFKGTLETPKLSDTICQFLLSSLPFNTRQIITGLRDSLSHSKTLLIRSDIENKTHSFFENIQSYISKMTVTITDILYKFKTKAIKRLINKSKSLKKVKDIKDLFRSFTPTVETFTEEANKIRNNTSFKGAVEQLEELVSDLDILLRDKTVSENRLFVEINCIILNEKTRLIFNKNDLQDNIKNLGFIFNHSEDIDVSEMNLLNDLFAEPVCLEESFMKLIHHPLYQLLQSIYSRIKEENDYEEAFALSKILLLLRFQVSDIKWIKEFEGILCQNKKQNAPIVKLKRNSMVDFLSPKEEFLKNLLVDNQLDTHKLGSNMSFESSAESLAVTEMLLLDILSISEVQLTRNPFYLDSSYSLHIGKNLRNQLAHENALINILSDVPRQILSNAKK